MWYPERYFFMTQGGGVLAANKYRSGIENVPSHRVAALAGYRIEAAHRSSGRGVRPAERRLSEAACA